MADDEEDIVKTETAKLKAKIEELQNAVSESEAAAKAAQTDSERISALLQAYEFSIDLVGYTIMITDFAYPITKVKNESWLTEGRKVCLRAIIIMEELVTGFVETDFASVEEKLLPLEEVIDDDEKWRLVRKTGLDSPSVLSATLLWKIQNGSGFWLKSAPVLPLSSKI